MIYKVAIPNRGEIAVRIIRAAQELGLKTLLLHSEADHGSLAWRLADEKKCLGGSRAQDSYLNQEQIIRFAVDLQAHIIHPGIGFLAEQASFAEACEKAGLIYVGPKREAIERLGDKMSAKKIAQELGIPTVDGFVVSSCFDSIKKQVMNLGLPVIAKASSGGGGFGLKIIREESEIESLIQSSQRESHSAFGATEVFIEKLIENARHIEVQIFGEKKGQVLILGERECSIQRRNQKVIEESPAQSLTSELRTKLHEAARRLAQYVEYTNAGTVEFLVKGDQYFFLEVNTRLQVEHPITEMVLGIDIVKAQLLNALGKEGISSDKIQVRGHSIECRIYAEDWSQGGQPTSGQISALKWPQGENIRVDSGYESGDCVSIFYDSLIAKIIVWDSNRSKALERMSQALRETVVFGVHTNLNFLQAVLRSQEVCEGKVHTTFLEAFRQKWPQIKELSADEKMFVEVAMKQMSLARRPSVKAAIVSSTPWSGHWRSV